METSWLRKNARAAHPDAMYELYVRTRDNIWLDKLYVLYRINLQNPSMIQYNTYCTRVLYRTTAKHYVRERDDRPEPEYNNRLP